MRKHLSFLSRLVPLFVPAAALIAQTDHTNAFTGTWKLNVAKTKFHLEADVKSETVTVASNGRTFVEKIDSDGQVSRWSYPRSDGKEVLIDGIGNATITETISGNAVDQRFQVEHKVIWKSHGFLVNDGRTVMLIVTSKDERGQLVSDSYIYDKQ